MSSPLDPTGPNDPREDSNDPLGTHESESDSAPPNSPSESFNSNPPDGAILSYNSSPNAGSSGPEPAYPPVPLPEWQFTGRSSRFLDPDLRVPWGWLDLLLLVIVYIGARVLSTILLVILFASRGVPWTAIEHSPRDLGFFVLGDQLIVYAALFFYLWHHLRMRLHVPFWSTIGWRKLELSHWPRPMAWLGFLMLGFALSASVQLVSVAFPPKTKLPIEALMQNHEAALALMAMSVLLAPVVEETIFRGYLYPVVARSFGVFAGVIVTGTIFGLLHAEQLWGGWAQISLLVVVGIVFTWVRAAKRNVFASYLVHVSYNFLVVLTGLHSLSR